METETIHVDMVKHRREGEAIDMVWASYTSVRQPPLLKSADSDAVMEMDGSLVMNKHCISRLPVPP